MNTGCFLFNISIIQIDQYTPTGIIAGWTAFNLWEPLRIRDQTKISNQEWKEIKKICLKHKDIIDDVYIIVLKRPYEKCFRKYFQREINKDRQSSYEIMDKHMYLDMYNLFYENISNLYKDCKKVQYIRNSFIQQIDIETLLKGYINEWKEHLKILYKLKVIHQKDIYKWQLNNII